MLNTNYAITLSTTDRNLVGDIRVRQADEKTQTFSVSLIEHGLTKTFENLSPFFCLMAREITGQGVSEEPVQIFDASKGTLEYTLSENAMQMIGKNEAYFSFRKEDSNGRWIEQFSTKSFYYTVEKSIYTQPFKDSNYWFTFKELYRKFIEYQESGKISWEQFVEQNREIIESIDPGGTILNRLGIFDSFRPFDYEILTKMENEFKERSINVKWFGIKNDGITDNSTKLQALIDSLEQGDTIYFPKGEYFFNKGIKINKPIKMVGNDREVTILKFDIPDSDKSAISIVLDKSYSNFYFSNFTMINTGNSLINGLSMDNSDIENETIGISSSVIDRISFSNFNVGLRLKRFYMGNLNEIRCAYCKTGILLAGFSTNLMVSSCYVENSRENGAGFELALVTYSTFIDCASDANLYGYKLTNCKAVNFINCGSEMSYASVYWLNTHNYNITIDTPYIMHPGVKSEYASWGYILHAGMYNENVILRNPRIEQEEKINNERKNAILASNTSLNFVFENLNNTSLRKIGMLSTYRINGVYYTNNIYDGSYYELSQKVYLSQSLLQKQYNIIKNYICLKSGFGCNNKWAAGKSYAKNEKVYVGNCVYKSMSDGTSGTVSPESNPENLTGYDYFDGNLAWRYIGDRAEFNLIVDGLSEGEFTPRLVCDSGEVASSYTIQKGYYKNTGASTQIFIHLKIDGIKNNGSTMRISSLPIPSKNEQFYSAVTASHVEGLTSETRINCEIRYASNDIHLTSIQKKAESNYGDVPLSTSLINSTFEIVITGIYCNVY